MDMVNVIYDKKLDMDNKFKLMQENARYEILNSMEACTMDLRDVKRRTSQTRGPVKVPKIFLSNECIFNCAYCNCRTGNECKMVYLTSPRDLAEFSVKVAADYGAGIFISSAIFKTPDYTTELITETLRIIRQDLCYSGYLHAKIMPGTDLELIRRAGQYADRLSINIEVAKSEGYQKIAKNKNKTNILTPMGHISRLIAQGKKEKSPWSPKFATSQTTQLMVGSIEEDDYTILNLSGALYKKYNLSRVYYTPFELKEAAAGYQDMPLTKTPTWRVQRLYQADRLIKLYGYRAEELIPSGEGRLDQYTDPKINWALHNLHLFPVEVNTADFETLIRIPGIGHEYARRVLSARRTEKITHEGMKRLGISLNKAKHFITCDGKYYGRTVDNSDILYHLLAQKPETAEQLQIDMNNVQKIYWFKPKHV